MEASSGDTCCIVYDVEVAEEVRRRGVGTRLVQMCEIVARKGGVGLVKCLIEEDRAATPGSEAFIAARLKGWHVDDAWNDRDSDRVLFAKRLVQPKVEAREAVAASEVQALAAQIQALAAGEGGKPAAKQHVEGSTSSPVTVLGPNGAQAKGGKSKKPERLFPKLGSHADSASDDEDGWVEDEDGREGADTQLEDIIEELAALFMDKHGREPSDEEVRRWISELKDAAEEESRVAAEGEKGGALSANAAAALAASLD